MGTLRFHIRDHISSLRYYFVIMISLWKLLLNGYFTIPQSNFYFEILFRDYDIIVGDIVEWILYDSTTKFLV